MDPTEDEDTGPRYRQAETIVAGELLSAFDRLHFFRMDPALHTQAVNIAIVDQFLMKLEYELIREQFRREQTPVSETLFLSAQSQMWIFAAYELLRTWRQRVRSILKWWDDGSLAKRLAEYEKKSSYRHFGRAIRARQIRSVIDSPGLIESLKFDMRLAYIPFARLETIRISLAKHEVRKEKDSVAQPPLGRINVWCGSLDFELESGRNIMGFISRRDIADEIRAMGTAMDAPSDSELREFEEFMRGPPEESE